jgi:Tol biopolymer transport system component
MTRTALAVLIAAAVANTASAHGLLAEPARQAASASLLERILFTAKRGSNWEIFSVAPDGSGLRNLSRSPAKDVSAAWSPNGTKIAFVRVARESPPDPTELFVMNADGSGQHQLGDVDSSSDWPRWSPDGKMITFLVHTSFRSGGAVTGEFFELHGIASSGGPVRRLAEGADAARDAWSWSPDSARLVFHRLGRGGRTFELAILDVRSGRTRALTNGRNPAWSPNGRWIAFSRTNGIYVIRPDGSARRRLTRGSDTSPTWSSDGRKLAFVRWDVRQPSGHVHVIRADGSAAWRVSAGRADVDKPIVWSPDGTRIAWSVGYDAPGAVLVARADGVAKPRKLINGFVAGWRWPRRASR